MKFSDNFIWGAASSAYQIEGTNPEDGRGDSIWDVYCKNPDNCAGAEANIACDHINRYQDDVRLMQKIGINAYRFSTSWSRVLPEGTGKINEKGLGFYDRLVDALLQADIEPYLTLFHWDYPQALYERGGWVSPESPHWFAEYAQVMVNRLGDRVKNWLTLNETHCFTALALFEGLHAPGDHLSITDTLQAIINTQLAHGLACQVIRSTSKLPVKLSLAHVGNYFYPANENEEMILNVRKEMYRIYHPNVFHINTLFLDPILLGSLPDDFYEVYDSNIPKIPNDYFEIAHQPIDYLGINIYFGNPINMDANKYCYKELDPPGMDITGSGWRVDPLCMYWGPHYLYDRYKLPLMITENGMANADWIAMDGKVHDPQRIDFTRRYLLALQKSHADGVPILGYFHWTLFDNFEWTDGYTKRFGLIHVDYQTQKRTLKDSALWYRKVIETNGNFLDFDPFDPSYQGLYLK